jgi:glycosyltransferase involved in cell wall biosynthesis
VNVALIAHGLCPIPPVGWGAVEIIIWQMKCGLERAGHHVDVYNTRSVSDVIDGVNRGHYDFVHCHNELLVAALNRHLTVPYALTSHYGGLYGMAAGASGYESFEPVIGESLSTPANIVLSERIARMYRRRGYAGFLRVLPNGVETSRFRMTAMGNGKAICLGRLCRRKRQEWLAGATRGQVAVDFVGPCDTGVEFQETETARYLGEWTRETIQERLTDYSCLVLMSESEAAAPLVVLEALAAGVSVVVNEACSDNLSEKAYITVLRSGADTPTETVAALKSAISENARWRPAIRQYALDQFDVALTVEKYMRLIEAFREECGSGRWS